MRQRWCFTLAGLACMAALIGPAPAQAKFERFGDRTLQRGDHGRTVRVLQRWLTRVGIRTSVDGAYGGRTVRSVRRYERRFMLKVDGRVTPSQARHIRAQALATAQAAPTPKAVIGPDGRTAIPPAGAPPQVVLAIAAANAITTRPYRYGGGHARGFDDSAYDCSGAISYALHGAGLLDSPLDSTGFMRWGDPGEGQWITIKANAGHAYIVVAGLRFDTSGKGEKGPRWRPETRSDKGFVTRHPPGL